MSILEQVIHTVKKRNKIKKVVIVGSGAVGKTSILQLLKMPEISILDGETKYTRTPFMNVDSKKIINNNNDQGFLQFYDLAGQINLPIHALKDFSSQVLGHTDVIFLVFANDNLQSFLDLKMWFQLVGDGLKDAKDLNSHSKVILINNKIDLPKNIDDSLIEYFLTLDPVIKGIFKISCLTKEGFPTLLNWIEEELFID